MCESNLQPLPGCGDHQIKLKHCPQPLNYFTRLSKQPANNSGFGTFRVNLEIDWWGRSHNLLISCYCFRHEPFSASSFDHYQSGCKLVSVQIIIHIPV